MWLFILSVSGALLISALCSLMEAALLSLRPSQIAEMSARSPRIGAVWQRLKAEIERPIAAILILNTAAHTIGASVAGSEFNALFGDEWIWVFSLVFTFLMLQFTEILPKSAGVRYNRQVAWGITGPLSLLVRVLHPVVMLMRDDSQSMNIKDRYLDEQAAQIVARATGRSVGAITSAQPTRAELVSALLEKDGRRFIGELELRGRLRVANFSNHVRVLETRTARGEANLICFYLA